MTHRMPLEPTFVRDVLSPYLEWELSLEGRIAASYAFENFTQMIEFVGVVAELAEDLQHHPELLLKFNVMHIQLWTTEKEAVTELDTQLALSISRAFRRFNELKQ